MASSGSTRGAASVVLRPALFERLGSSARVTVIAAPAGSGKTVLLRSWAGEAAVTDRAAFVAVGRDERDPQRFWLSVVAALSRTGPGAQLVRAVTAAPDLDGWALVERLLEDLAPLDERLWLVVDDVHELGSTEVLSQLELLVMRAPPDLRFALATRHDVRLGLHRLRLEGALAEMRAADLRFSVVEAGELLKGAGVDLTGPTLNALYERTEGWAAGLRLAALSLSGHEDPERFAREFSGSERTVAEYLLAEVLESQSEQVRRLLLRTSVLERVNGELADLLTGDEGGERVLQDLERANAFVVSLDPARSWFRYHQLFRDLLAVELRGAEPGEVTGLHLAAAAWLADHGYPVEAVRHAQAAQDFGLAARLLADHWPSLRLDGRAADVHELLSGFPRGLLAADAELAVLAGGDELAQGSFEKAEQYLRRADRGADAVSPGRRDQFRLLCRVVSLLLAYQRGDPQAAAEEAQKLLAIAENTEIAEPTLGEDLRALALISLAAAEFWAPTYEDATRQLTQGVALARRIGRPFLELTGLAYLAMAESHRSPTAGAELGKQAVELAEEHGWTDDPAFGVACLTVGAALVQQGRTDEAEPWVQHAERVVQAEAQPLAGTVVRYVRAALELERNRDGEALAAFEAAERLGQRVSSTHYSLPRTRRLRVHALVRLGRIERAEEALAGLSQQDREHADIRIAAADVQLARADPLAAIATLAKVIDGSVPVDERSSLAVAYLVEARAQDALGDEAAAQIALEHALDIAEPYGWMSPFLFYPATAVLERHARHGTAHGALVAEIRSLLSGARPSPTAAPLPLRDALSDAELRVLRYLPTNLTAPEIAREIYVSHNTVKTHIRNLYAKLGTNRRAAAVSRARDLGLLAPSGAPPKAATPKP